MERGSYFECLTERMVIEYDWLKANLWEKKSYIAAAALPIGGWNHQLLW
jgi:hypothetical protein